MEQCAPHTQADTKPLSFSDTHTRHVPWINFSYSIKTAQILTCPEISGWHNAEGQRPITAASWLLGSVVVCNELFMLREEVSLSEAMEVMTCSGRCLSAFKLKVKGHRDRAICIIYYNLGDSSCNLVLKPTMHIVSEIPKKDIDKVK